MSLPNVGMATRFAAIMSSSMIYYILIDEYNTIGIFLGWIPAGVVGVLILHVLKDWMVGVAALIISMVFLVYIQNEINRYLKILEFLSNLFG